jgi:hypothetical protein
MSLFCKEGEREIFLTPHLNPLPQGERKRWIPAGVPVHGEPFRVNPYDDTGRE